MNEYQKDSFVSGGDDRGLASIVIPAFNRSSLLRECLHSVVNQSYRPLEVIVVDDGSDEALEPAVSEFSGGRDIVLKYLRRENGGVGAARETGRTALTGEYVQYLDSDDLLHQQKIELSVRALREQPRAGAAYCRTVRFSGKPDVSAPAAALTGAEVKTLMPGVFRKRVWHTLTPLWRRETVERIGAWSLLRNWEDWEYDCRACLLGVILCYVPQTLAFVRDHKNDRLSGGWSKNEGKLRDCLHAVLNVMALAEKSGRLSKDVAWALGQRSIGIALRAYLIGSMVLGDRAIRCVSELSVRSESQELWAMSRLGTYVGRKHLPLRIAKRIHDEFIGMTG